MARLTKTDAAKAIGVARQTLYDYLNKGRISADPDGRIDTAELIRAGFTLHVDMSPDGLNHVYSGRDVTHRIVSDAELPEHDGSLTDTQTELIDTLRQDLEREREEKARLLAIVESQQQLIQEAQHTQQKLLTAAPTHQTGVVTKVWRWLFGPAAPPNP